MHTQVYNRMVKKEFVSGWSASDELRGPKLSAPSAPPAKNESLVGSGVLSKRLFVSPSLKIIGSAIKVSLKPTILYSL